MMQDSDSKRAKLYKGYEKFKKYGFWCTVYFHDTKLSIDQFNYKQVLTQFKKQPVAKEVHASVTFCNLDKLQNVMIVKEESLYLSTALINLIEYFRREYNSRFSSRCRYFFACELEPPSYEEVAVDNELECISFRTIHMIP